MSGQDDDSDKSFDPTPERLRKAREDGQIVKSTDLNTAAAYLALAVICATLAGALLSAIGTTLAAMVAQAPDLAHEAFSGRGAPVAIAIVAPLSVPVMLWLVIPALGVLGSLTAQRAIKFTPKNLIPKPSRINPIATAKQKFGRNGLFEFAKSATKLCLYGLLAVLFLRGRMDDILVSSQLEPYQITQAMMQLMRDLLTYVVVLAVVLGGIDYMWQSAEHHRKNMMSRQDLKDEHKDSEGDPEQKQKRRQRAQEIALNSMMADVENADVVIVNPTHYAVALQWDRSSAAPPVCIAKGVDEIALRIRARASQAEVPIHSDPPTARMLHAALDIGDFIDEAHFAAVAAAIRFADEMRKKARL